LIDTLAPYIHTFGLAACILIVGTTALMAATADSEAARPAALALTGALLTWGATAFVILNPFPIAWFRAATLSMWLLLSVLAGIVAWYCRPPVRPDEPPEEPHVFPKINGKFVAFDKTSGVEADMLRRTYRARTRK
jgi:hypothetical protein